MDTIFALATAPGRAGVAMIRVSGMQAVAAVAQLAGSVPASRGLRKLRDRAGQVLDQALVLRFAAGQSFTGEEVVELHLHGSQAVVAAVLQTLAGIDGLRMAGPGEFTRRALENGCLDLAEVEGLADLIDAETESQRKHAMRLFSGALGDLAAGWRTKLLRAAALVEAVIDFVDEDVPLDVLPEVRGLLAVTREEMTREAEGVAIAERLRAGFEVAIIGAPNVGKSTLLNRIAGRDVAITSHVAGTTRDVIEVQMDLHGVPVTLIDTAGLRETEDAVEKIGVARARARAAEADLRVHLVMEDEKVEGGADDVVLRAKCDDGASGVAGVSGRTGAGVAELLDVISTRLAARVARAGTASRARHAVALKAAVSHLLKAEEKIAQPEPLDDLVAEDVRAAVRAVDSIVGRVDVEHVLGEIFASFCIGK